MKKNPSKEEMDALRAQFKAEAKRRGSMTPKARKYLNRALNKCDECGRFKKWSDLGEIDYADGYKVDTQMECRGCMSKVDRDRCFPGGSE